MRQRHEVNAVAFRKFLQGGGRGGRIGRARLEAGNLGQRRVGMT